MVVGCGRRGHNSTQAPGLRHGISTIPNLEPASHITGGSVLGSTSTSRSFPQRDMHRPSQNINRHIIPRPSSLTSDVVAVLIRSQARGSSSDANFTRRTAGKGPVGGLPIRCGAAVMSLARNFRVGRQSSTLQYEGRTGQTIDGLGRSLRWWAA